MSEGARGREHRSRWPIAPTFPDERAWRTRLRRTRKPPSMGIWMRSKPQRSRTTPIWRSITNASRADAKPRGTQDRDLSLRAIGEDRQKGRQLRDAEALASGGAPALRAAATWCRERCGPAPVSLRARKSVDLRGVRCDVAIKAVCGSTRPVDAHRLIQGRDETIRVVSNVGHSFLAGCFRDVVVREGQSPQRRSARLERCSACKGRSQRYEDHPVQLGGRSLSPSVMLRVRRAHAPTTLVLTHRASCMRQSARMKIMPTAVVKVWRRASDEA